ncbi:low molecular weight phosphotyrosine protein phosphatase [halophilic archaeon]|nr:low molecular weight phosphotyrosine protein phosphatase [halophilic archaeon]
MLDHLHHGRRRVAVEMDRLRLRASNGRVLDAETAVRSLPPDPGVVFLCLGNICRSPLAERYFRTRIEETDCDPSLVTSAGFVDTEGRESPDPAVSVARDHGVDLADHRSQRVSERLLDAGDLVLLMDAWNYRDLKREFPAALEKTCFLKAFDPGTDFEIADPYGDDPEEFRAVYDEVTDSVDELVDALAER